MVDTAEGEKPVDWLCPVVNILAQAPIARVLTCSGASVEASARALARGSWLVTRGSLVARGSKARLGLRGLGARCSCSGLLARSCDRQTTDSALVVPST